MGHGNYPAVTLHRFNDYPCQSAVGFKLDHLLNLIQIRLYLFSINTSKSVGFGDKFDSGQLGDVVPESTDSGKCLCSKGCAVVSSAK